MKTKLIFLIVVLAATFSPSNTLIHTHGLMGMGGLKGHRGHGAVELLLATGILAKLLNHRAKHGASLAGRHLLHALLGGHRYSQQQHTRFPLDMQSLHPSLLQDDLLDTHASMAALSMPMNDADLLMNQESALYGVRSPMMMSQESALLGARAPMLMSPSMFTDTSSLLAAEAQLSQQLLAARRARRLMEARKMLAAQEANQFFAAQSEVNNILAAQEAVHQHGFLSADQSRQIFTSIAPPRSMPQRNIGNPLQFSGQSSGNIMGSHTLPQYQGLNTQQNSGSQGVNFQGSSGQSGMMGSESVQNSQRVVYSQPSPVYPGPSHSSSSSEGNYHSSSLQQGNFHSGSSQPQGYSSKSSAQVIYNNGYSDSSSQPQGYNSKSSAQGIYNNGYSDSSSQPEGYSSKSSAQGIYNNGYSDSSSQPQGYKSSSQGNYNNGYAARQGNSFGSSRFQSSSAQKKNGYVTPELTKQLQASGRSDEEYTIPSDMDVKDAAKIVAGLKGML